MISEFQLSLTNFYKTHFIEHFIKHIFGKIFFMVASKSEQKHTTNINELQMSNVKVKCYLFRFYAFIPFNVFLLRVVGVVSNL